jgi:ferrochelatase
VGEPAYDALLLVSFGGPEQPADVLPFLRNVTAGRQVPEERLAAVAEHYHRFGGVSPINGQNRALRAALAADFAAAGLDLPIYWGNRNWHPLLADTVREMAGDGVRRALAFVTSAFASYSGCRQYREDLAAARAEVGPAAPEVDKIRLFFDHPGFVTAMADRVRAALAGLPADRRPAARLVFTAHSVPLEQTAASGPGGHRYPAQLAESAGLIAAAAAPGHGWDVVYQSRSGPPSQPWLEPDVLDHLDALAAGRTPAVVLVPVGFVSDHMEVVYDLDTEAADRAAALGLPLVRAGTAGIHPAFVAMVRSLVLERLCGRPRAALGRDGPSWDRCPGGCCLPAGRPTRPAVSGT